MRDEAEYGWMIMRGDDFVSHIVNFDNPYDSVTAYVNFREKSWRQLQIEGYYRVARVEIREVEE